MEAGKKASKPGHKPYLACVAAVDDNVGQVLDALDSSPLKENTIVVLASDHGLSHGRKGLSLQEFVVGRKYTRAVNDAGSRAYSGR